MAASPQHRHEVRREVKFRSTHPASWYSLWLTKSAPPGPPAAGPGWHGLARPHTTPRVAAKIAKRDQPPRLWLAQHSQSTAWLGRLIIVENNTRPPNSGAPGHTRLGVGRRRRPHSSLSDCDKRTRNRGRGGLGLGVGGWGLGVGGCCRHAAYPGLGLSRREWADGDGQRHLRGRYPFASIEWCLGARATPATRAAPAPSAGQASELRDSSPER